MPTRIIARSREKQINANNTNMTCLFYLTHISSSFFFFFFFFWDFGFWFLVSFSEKVIFVIVIAGMGLSG